MLNNTEIKSINAMKDFFSGKGITLYKALLFGSRARGDNQNDSDYDFLFVTEEEINSASKRRLKAELQKELIRQNALLPMDLLIKSFSIFQDEILSPYNISYSANMEGVKI